MIKKLLILNGPNINMLGIREPEHYGREDYPSLVEKIRSYCEEKGLQTEFFQSNHEGELVDRIQQSYGRIDGIVFNPAAYTHTSVALLDALKAVKIPTVEVHISKLEDRDAFRQISYVRQACIGTVTGLGTDGYLRAVDMLLSYGKEQ